MQIQVMSSQSEGYLGNSALRVDKIFFLKVLDRVWPSMQPLIQDMCMTESVQAEAKFILLTASAGQLSTLE